MFYKKKKSLDCKTKTATTKKRTSLRTFFFAFLFLVGFVERHNKKTLKVNGVGHLAVVMRFLFYSCAEGRVVGRVLSLSIVGMSCVVKTEYQQTVQLCNTVTVHRVLALL